MAPSSVACNGHLLEPLDSSLNSPPQAWIRLGVQACKVSFSGFKYQWRITTPITLLH
ncbi:hypothetical protein Bca101_059393 [Brassica carinata]